MSGSVPPLPLRDSWRAQEPLLALGPLYLLVRLSRCKTHQPPTENVLHVPMCVGIKRLLSTFTVL